MACRSCLKCFAYCGKRFQVQKRAHKTCDTVFPVRGRRVDRAIHLETRCDGQAHGGCQAGCLIFWKEAWVKPVNRGELDAAAMQIPPNHRDTAESAAGDCTERDVFAGTQSSGSNGEPLKYVCQATRLPYATRELNWWDIRQYVEDYRSGNVGLARILGGLIYASYYNLSQIGIGLGRPMRWFYNLIYPLWRGSPWPRTNGTIPDGQPTPIESLDLQPGELVRVKSQEAILRTVTNSNKNRGMYWDAELVPYCGGTYRVLKRVNRIIDEKTGLMQEMKNPCIILDSVVCQARYSACRMFCPRAIYPYWREIWLERAEPNSIQSGQRNSVRSR